MTRWADGIGHATAQPYKMIAGGNHDVAAASQDPSVIGGQRIQLPDGSTGTITLKGTGDFEPYAGWFIEFLCQKVYGGTGTRWTFKDDAGTTLATFDAPASAGHQPLCSIRFYYAGRNPTGPTAVWQIGENSGTHWDGSAAYGVVFS